MWKGAEGEDSDYKRTEPDVEKTRRREGGGNDLLTKPDISDSAYPLWDRKEGLHAWHRGTMNKLSRTAAKQYGSGGRAQSSCCIPGA
jgi:hypothetical protein